MAVAFEGVMPIFRVKDMHASIDYYVRVAEFAPDGRCRTARGGRA